METIESTEKGLLDTLHKCIMCNSTAYKVEDGRYECSKCSFEWRVLSCE